jgi:hypothetical protein
MAHMPTAELVRQGHTRFERVVAHEIPGSPGRHTYETQVTFLDKTNRIPLEKGHGYSVYLIPRGGSDGTKVSIRWTVHIPSPGIRDPRSGVVDRQITMTEAGAYGRETRIGWQFDGAWQMIAGAWKIEIEIDGIAWETLDFTAR